MTAVPWPRNFHMAQVQPKRKKKIIAGYQWLVKLWQISLLECHNKIPQTVWLKQKFIFSQFQRLKG